MNEEGVKILDWRKPGVLPQDVEEFVARLEHLHAGIPTCYVAVSDNNEIAYMQWLMGAEENEKIQLHFNGIFPLLAPDQALLENAFTFAEFRGKGIMPAAMARIAERGFEIGAQRIITFVGEHNIASLKGCKRAGFTPCMIRNERWLLFRRKLSFTKLPNGTPYPFDSGSPAPSNPEKVTP